MNILVLNVGSSSVKYSVFKDEKEILEGLVDKIGEKTGEFKDHESVIEHIEKELVSKNISIDVIGHRVVHGGKEKESKVVDNEFLKEIEKYSDLAPLHNPHEINGIKISKKLGALQVAVFDTAFHSTIPSKASTYALPNSLCKKYGIKRYGFHGISHSYIASVTEGKVISCHLGSGSSVCAIINGKSVDTSMGFTPAEGLVMGTRAGSIDPGIIPFLIEKEEYSWQQIEHVLNEESGLKGLSGKNDLRELLTDDSKEGKLAVDIFVYSIVKHIGSYAAAMNGVDEIVFTAGIGENSSEIRKRVCNSLSYLGVIVDDERNTEGDMLISSDNSKVKVKVIKTNEELMIAKEVKKAVTKSHI